MAREYMFRGVTSDGSEVFGNLIVSEVPVLGGFFKKIKKQYKIQLEGQQDEFESVIPESIGMFVKYDETNQQLFEYDLVKVMEDENELYLAVLVYSNSQALYMLVDVDTGVSYPLYEVLRDSLSLIKVGNAFLDSDFEKYQDYHFNTDVAQRILNNEY